MKKELIEQKKELEQKLVNLNAKINIEILREDVSALEIITDTLNALFQDKIVEKYGSTSSFGSCESASNLLYEAMQILDKACVSLIDEVESLESELENN
jgi:hypothetical protein